MPEDQDFYTMIRIASTGGFHLVDIPRKVFDHIASAEKISWIEPVGWLNEQTLVVQVRFEDWNNAALIRVNLDGSNPLYLASGTFVAFLYP
jgi:Tfp pilus assembly protein PilZ